MGKYISECYLKNQYLYELERITIDDPEREDSMYKQIELKFKYLRNNPVE